MDLRLDSEPGPWTGTWTWTPGPRSGYGPLALDLDLGRWTVTWTFHQGLGPRPGSGSGPGPPLRSRGPWGPGSRGPNPSPGPNPDLEVQIQGPVQRSKIQIHQRVGPDADPKRQFHAQIQNEIKVQRPRGPDPGQGPEVQTQVPGAPPGVQDPDPEGRSRFRSRSWVRSPNP